MTATAVAITRMHVARVLVGGVQKMLDMLQFAHRLLPCAQAPSAIVSASISTMPPGKAKSTAPSVAAPVQQRSEPPCPC